MIMRLAIHQADAFDRELELTSADFRIGRGPENKVVLVDPTKAVSRKHAELRYEDGHYVLLDLRSQNGIWCNGRRQAKITMEPGTPVTIGSYTLTLVGAPEVTDETLVAPRSAQLVTAEPSKRSPAKPEQPRPAPGLIAS